MSKPRDPSWLSTLIMLALICAVVAVLLPAGASITPPDNNQVKREIDKNEFLISQITYCRLLAINGGMPEQAKNYAVKLKTFDAFYLELKIFHAGQVIGFLKGINYQKGFLNPTKDQVKKLAIELYFRQCDITF